MNENKTTKELIRGIVSEPKLRILNLLSQREMTYTELKTQLHLSETAFLNHLRELSQGKGLITKDQEGKYALTKEGQKHLKKLTLMQLFSEMLDILLEEEINDYSH